ncbi:MAG: hypothetical protein RLZZ624_63 [Cyanobacteriota bacterium]|jgi:branched-chain amino acid transport system ATP-binding protein
MSSSSLPLLSLDRLSCRFGGLQALDRVSFAVHPGEIFGLIGPNGAGKTTLFNLISGVTPISSGDVCWQGQTISALPPDRLNRLGLARTFQNLRLFDRLTVLENLLVAQASQRRSQPEALATAWGLLEELALSGLAERDAGTLAYGDRRRLEIARALATRPTLLLLDEPAAGLNPSEKERLGQLIAELRQRHQLTVMIIEHHVPLLMGLCDRLAVLDFGALIALGTPEQVRTDPRVIAAYLGGGQ